MWARSSPSLGFTFAAVWLAGYLSLVMVSGQGGDWQFHPSRLNDNYCDCPLTNQDEPLTSACSPVGVFKCADRPDRVSVPSSRVDDGVCDCCDGSDEREGLCKNTCEELDRKERELKEAQAKVRLEGEQAFMQLVDKAKQLVCNTGQGHKGGDEENATETVSEEDLKAAEDKVKQLEMEEEETVIETRIDSLHLDKLSKRELQRVVVKLAAEAQSGVALERLVAGTTSCSGSKAGKKDSEDEDYASETETEDIPKPPPSDEVDAIHQDCDPVWTGQSEFQASEELEEARKTLRKLEARSGKNTGEDDDNIDDSKLDFGPGKVWRALKNECFQLKKDQYEYELCLFGQFKQDHVRLGKFSKWIASYGEMLYDHGDMCFSPAVARSVHVKIKCGATTELLDVSEPSTCVYEATLQSPAACVPEGFSVDVETVCAAATSS